MPPATPDRPDEEELMIRYLSEAGDPHVEPRPEHVALVRSLLLDRLDPVRPSPAHRWKARLLVGSGMAAAAVALALLALVRPGIAWAQVAEALRGRPWVHGKVVGHDGRELVEQWLSSDRQRGGERAGPLIAFHDYRRKILTKYFPDKGVVYRLPQPPEQAGGEADFLQQVLDLLREPAGPPRFPFPGKELIGQSRREVEEGGKRWLEIALTLRVAWGSRGPDTTMRIRVDPATKLPNSLVFDAEYGKRYTAAIDYPDRGPADIYDLGALYRFLPRRLVLARGPADIYDLGAPRTAKIIDRIPPDSVGRVLAGLEAGRRQFDDYTAFVVEERLRPAGRLPRVTVNRVWRKGPRWRVEQMRSGRSDWAPPAGADAAWWRAHEGDFAFVPRAVCDGEAYWEYYLADGWRPGMPVPEPGAPNHSGQTVGPNALMGPGDDPVLPFWAQDLLTEQAGHPTAGIGEPGPDREFLVDAETGDGPPGTILLRGRDAGPRCGAAMRARPPTTSGSGSIPRRITWR